MFFLCFLFIIIISHITNSKEWCVVVVVGGEREERERDVSYEINMNHWGNIT